MHRIIFTGENPALQLGTVRREFNHFIISRADQVIMLMNSHHIMDVIKNY